MSVKERMGGPMRFQYRTLKTRRPVYPLGGRPVRYRPLVPIQVISPLGWATIDGNLDTGSDDTLFPLRLCSGLGLNLAGAPQGESLPVGGSPIPYPYATVRLRLTDTYEEYVWEAIVGFLDTPRPWAVLGYAGMQQFFDIDFLGYRREAILRPNASFQGQARVLRPPPP
jgi:hypothetical protein